MTDMVVQIYKCSITWKELGNTIATIWTGLVSTLCLQCNWKI